MIPKILELEFDLEAPININVEANQFKPDKNINHPTVIQKKWLLIWSGFIKRATTNMETAIIRNRIMLNNFMLKLF